jgi:hypothetical protein
MGRGVSPYALEIEHKILLCHRFCAEGASVLIPMTELHDKEEYKGLGSKIMRVF